MSAWIVSRLHIDHVVYGLTKRELVEGLSPNELGRALWEANIVAVETRYRPDHSTRALKGHARRYVYAVPMPTPHPFTIDTLTASYGYQTSELDDYEGSFAETCVRSLREALAREGFDASDLSVSDPRYAWSI